MGGFAAGRHPRREGTVMLPATGERKTTSEHMWKFHRTVRRQDRAQSRLKPSQSSTLSALLAVKLHSVLNV